MQPPPPTGIDWEVTCRGDPASCPLAPRADLQDHVAAIMAEVKAGRYEGAIDLGPFYSLRWRYAPPPTSVV